MGFFVFSFFSPFVKSVFAVSVSIIDPPSTITSDTFTLTASISGASTGTNYLRVDVYKEGTTNYFGETYNGSDWYSGSNGEQYLSLSAQSGVIWNGTIQGRIGSPNTTDYDGTGSYRMRLKRYTNSGSAGSEDANNSSVSILISFPTSTPLPTNTPVPTSTSAPIPTKTPTPLPTPKSPTSTPIISGPTVKPTAISSLTIFPTSVLGKSTKSAINGISLTTNPKSNISPSIKETKLHGANQNNLSKILIGIGIIFLISCAILVFLSYKRNKGGDKTL
mgnify:CR=1 FL=1